MDFGFIAKQTRSLTDRGRVLGVSDTEGASAEIGGQTYDQVPVIGGRVYQGQRPIAGFRDHQGRRQPFLFGEEQARERVDQGVRARVLDWIISTRGSSYADFLSQGRWTWGTQAVPTYESAGVVLVPATSVLGPLNTSFGNAFLQFGWLPETSCPVGLVAYKVGQATLLACCYLPDDEDNLHLGAWLLSGEQLFSTDLGINGLAAIPTGTDFSGHQGQQRRLGVVLQYHPALGNLVLVLNQDTGFDASAGVTATGTNGPKILMADGLTGELLVSRHAPTISNPNPDVTSRLYADFTAGYAMLDNRIVKTRWYHGGYAAWRSFAGDGVHGAPYESTARNLVYGFDLSKTAMGADSLWAFNPETLMTGVQHPRIAPCEEMMGSFVYASPAATNYPGQAAATLPPAPRILQGHYGTVLATQQFVVLPFSGFVPMKGLYDPPGTVVGFTASDPWSQWYTYDSPIAGQARIVDVGGGVKLDRRANVYITTNTGSSAAPGFVRNAIGNSIGGRGVDGGYATGRFDPISGEGRAAHAYVVALDAAGLVKWKYEFPPLLASDSANYLVNSSSFGQNGATFTADLTANFDGTYGGSASYIGYPGEHLFDFSESYGNIWVSDQPGGGVGSISLPYLSLWSVETTIPPAATPRGYRPVSHNVWDYLGGAAVEGDPASYTMVDSYPVKWPQALSYWPRGGTYLFDPIPTMLTDWSTYRGDLVNAGAHSIPPTQGHITADEHEDCYLHFLQPFGIISAVPPWQLCNLYRSFKSLLGFWTEYDSAVPVGDPGLGNHAITVNQQWFDIPFRHNCYRSFTLAIHGSGPKKGQKKWQVETTTYLDDLLRGHGELAGKVPFASCALRMLAMGDKLLTLRTVKLGVQVGTFTGAANSSQLYKAFPAPDFVEQHKAWRFAKIVLDCQSTKTGQVLWTRTVWDGTAHGNTGLHLVGAFMDGEDGKVVGRVSMHDTPDGFTSRSVTVSKMFVCDLQGNLALRDANADDPYPDGTHENFIWTQASPGGIAFDRSVKPSTVLGNGKLYYHWYDQPNLRFQLRVLNLNT